MMEIIEEVINLLSVSPELYVNILKTEKMLYWRQKKSHGSRGIAFDKLKRRRLGKHDERWTLLSGLFRK